MQLNEVYIDQADEFGMPPLADEATTGVPEVRRRAGQPGDTGSVGAATAARGAESMYSRSDYSEVRIRQSLAAAIASAAQRTGRGSPPRRNPPRARREPLFVHVRTKGDDARRMSRRLQLLDERLRRSATAC